jgi:hypothetical protein
MLHTHRIFVRISGHPIVNMAYTMSKNKNLKSRINTSLCKKVYPKKKPIQGHSQGFKALL